MSFRGPEKEHLLTYIAEDAKCELRSWVELRTDSIAAGTWKKCPLSWRVFPDLAALARINDH